VQKANAQHANYSKTQIRALNKQWQQQLNSSDKPLINSVMNNGLSALLEKIEEHSNGLYQGIIMTDSKGLNIGQTYMTGQYWQGGKSFWKKAFKTSPGNPYIFQGSNRKGQLKPAMIALPILDSHNTPIGVVAVDINISKLASS
jgi:sensor histidine kinase regulating citrate/malate metabolism